jgi:phage protein D
VLNNLATSSGLVQPRGTVTLNGTTVFFTSFEVDNNNFYEADTFECELPLFGQPTGIDLNWWANISEIIVNIYAGFPVNPQSFTLNDLTNIFTGIVDNLEIAEDSEHGLYIRLTGRSLAARLIDTKTTQKFLNQTASQIATFLAEKYGLTPVVTPTSTLAGRYYQIDYSKLNTEHSEWDLLTYLAQQEGFVTYVRGQSLYFRPRPETTDNPYVVTWDVAQGLNPSVNPTSSSVGINLTRNLMLAKDVIVKVRTFNAKTGKPITVQVTATHNYKTVLKGLPPPVGKAQEFNYTIPGLSKEQALQRAQELLKGISIHEVKLYATLPGDVVLFPENIIKLQDTNSDFDQTFYPDSIVRRMSISEGFRMQVEAKNHLTSSQVLI